MWLWLTYNKINFLVETRHSLTTNPELHSYFKMFHFFFLLWLLGGFWSLKLEASPWHFSVAFLCHGRSCLKEARSEAKQSGSVLSYAAWQVPGAADAKSYISYLGSTNPSTKNKKAISIINTRNIREGNWDWGMSKVNMCCWHVRLYLLALSTTQQDLLDGVIPDLDCPVRAARNEDFQVEGIPADCVHRHVMSFKHIQKLSWITFWTLQWKERNQRQTSWSLNSCRKMPLNNRVASRDFLGWLGRGGWYPEVLQKINNVAPAVSPCLAGGKSPAPLCNTQR